ncbi:hypothetical protein [Trebonia kvetii]|uniref:hypothetical protein n=1 Tax=Trebonia kvetii TaxID=2480626 RepID=UPI0016522C79|nr:hypothetical protein [Trebonia kvetii]
MRLRTGVLLVGVSTVAVACGGTGPQAPGTVAGTFEGVGGPAVIKNGIPQTPVFPLSGTVTFTDAAGHATLFTIGAAGTFSVRLAAGTYSVSGRTPSVAEANKDGSTTPIPCSLPRPIQVRPSRTTRITIICSYS